MGNMVYIFWEESLYFFSDNRFDLPKISTAFFCAPFLSHFIMSGRGQGLSKLYLARKKVVWKKYW